MTMVSPEGYLENQKDKSYPELIRERDGLIGFIREYEEAESAGAGTVSGNNLSGGCGQVMYQMYLEYLSVLCRFMHKKYNLEYVWGERTLKQDAEGKKNGS